MIIFAAPEKGHWPLNLLLILIAIPGTFEASRLFGMNPRKTLLRVVGLVIISVTLPIILFLWVLDIVESRFLLPLYTGLAMCVIFVQVFNQQSSMSTISKRTSRHLAVIAYPGLLIVHLIMLSKLPDASRLCIIFLTSVVLNDTMAYLTGQLYKKRHVHPTALSPNKTTAGFIVGFIFSPIGFLLGYYFSPSTFPAGWWSALVLGLLVGFTTIAGDLIESGLKRSVRRKDSGKMFTGRGGVLDSTDSLLYSAPVVFYGYQIITNIWVL